MYTPCCTVCIAHTVEHAPDDRQLSCTGKSHTVSCCATCRPELDRYCCLWTDSVRGLACEHSVPWVTGWTGEKTAL